MKKALIKVAVFTVLQFVILFLYGFVIKGNIGIIFYAIMAIVSLIMLISAFKEKASEKMALILFITALLTFSYGQVYELMNNSDYSNMVEEVNAKYYEPEGRQTFLDYGWYFEDEDGETIFIRSYNLFYQNDDLNDGDEVLLYKYEGMFGVYHYNLKYIDKSDQ